MESVALLTMNRHMATVDYLQLEQQLDIYCVYGGGSVEGCGV